MGSDKLIPLDLRVVAATKVDLRKAATEGGFREDLYYRLNVVTIEIHRCASVGSIRYCFITSYSPLVPAMAAKSRHRPRSRSSRC